MSKIVLFRSKRRIEVEAAEWLARLDRRLDPAEEVALKRWLAADRRHAQTLSELARLWDDMSLLDQLAELFPLPQITGQASPRRWALAAAAVLLAGLAVMFAGWDPVAPEPPRHYATAVGQQSDIQLADGSTARLNTDSQLEVGFNQRERVVRLLRGEAHFDVAHEPARPFQVITDTGTVQALGTAFTVRIREMDVEVVVTDGRVQVTPAASTATAEEVGGNGVMRYDASGITEAAILPAEELARRLAWQQGMLAFAGTPLEQVIAEVRRYTPTRIEIADPALRDVRIGGYFRVGDVDTLLTLLRNNFAVRVEHRADNSVYLWARSA